MTVDDSFKKPGAVPFKWEIRPGVPKVQQPQPQPPRPPPPPPPQEPSNHHRTSSNPPQKLRPPPSGSYFHPPPELRTRSFRSAPRSRSHSRSERWRFDQPILDGPISVSPGCFPSSPLLGRKGNKKSMIHKARTGPEPDYTSHLETLARWSTSTHKSLSPFRYSPQSSYSSYQSSPRPVSDAEWAGYGLF
ncbi:hypothetical protein L1049_027012 [Liquidambar formosana]|uniref:Uncharacterized protein n=1 Tax=Liquidambar formosana TaxID=63359 RepID=A0AAP0R647_LIQFO